MRWWPYVKRAVARRAKGRCEGCGWSPEKDPEKRWWVPENGGLHFEFDHIAEIAAGGDPLDVANVQLLCRRCHKEKTRRFNSRGHHIASPGGVLTNPHARSLLEFETAGRLKRDP